MAIKSIKHKGLKRLYIDGIASGVNSHHADKLTLIMDSIEFSHHPHDLAKVYKAKFAEKKGSGKGVYSIVVNGNWRVTFQIEDDGAVFLDYLDYHGKQIKAIK
jgi:proteic killer suppression protein